ncbi:DUF935 domain-containing protein [Arenimonas sp.]|uniref:DUF935 domain-containing protein n=1 Tax=Arenimonas sp. TaxID=1872635 RepID=UPI0025C66185|nr:DUF935 domain-containing protein [Arenimonas sp.]
MPRILDATGQPIDAAVLSEPQTSRPELAHLQGEFARHPARGLTPAKLQRIMSDAELGSLIEQMELFEDMEERDAHLYAEMMKRRGALLTVDWSIVEPPNADAREKAATEFLREAYQGITELEDTLLDMMDAVGKGFACLEIEWGLVDGLQLPRRVTLQPQSWFMLDRATRRQLRLRSKAPDGDALWPFGWITHVHKAKSGYLSRAGLHRVLAWPYLFKNYGVRDLAEFLEIYGLPMRVGKYPMGASEAEKAALLAAVVNLGHNAGGIMPAGMALDFQKAADGTEGPFLAMVRWAEASISKAILGQTLTADAGNKGSHALGTVHNEVRLDIRKADAKQVAATLTRDLNFPLLAINFPGGQLPPHRCPRFEFDVFEPEDVTAYATHYPKLAAAGVRIPISYITKKLRIPEPVDGEAVMSAPPPQAPGQGALPGARRPADARAEEERIDARVRHALATQTPPIAPARDALDDLVDEALGDWQPAVEQMLEPIMAEVRAAAADGATVEQLKARLAELLPRVPADKLAETLARAAFVARLAGEADLSLNRHE